MKSLKVGFKEIHGQIKTLLRSTNKNGNIIYLLPSNDSQKLELHDREISLSRILSGIQVSWAEESIKRLYYEGNLFSDVQRNFLLGKKALEQKWYASLLIVFSKAYNLITPGDELCSTVNVERQRRNLGDELVDQYFEMKRIIRDYLIPSFNIRNKVQHGEWKRAFAPPLSSNYSQLITDNLDAENIVTTTARFHIVDTFYNMIVDMGRFKSNAFKIDSIQTPFEYFYKRYMGKINEQVKILKNPKIDEFRLKIASSAERATQHKQRNSATRNNSLRP